MIGTTGTLSSGKTKTVTIVRSQTLVKIDKKFFYRWITAKLDADIKFGGLMGHQRLF